MRDSHELDRRALRRAFDKAADTFDEAAALHHEVRRRLFERLEVIRDEPKAILDLGSATGQGSRDLKKRYPRARVIAIDWSMSMLRMAQKQIRWLRSFDRICADAAALPLQPQTVDWCISNLMLASCDPPDVVFSEVQRVLRPGGLFMFTSFGPDTLKELRAHNAYASVHSRVHRFIDMHDLGDSLAKAGFAEPVMDVERIALTYEGARKMFAELQQTGSTNALLSRPRHLNQRTALDALVSRYDAQSENGRISATFEIIYGHAWRGEKRHSGAPTETHIPLESLRGRVRSPDK